MAIKILLVEDEPALMRVYMRTLLEKPVTVLQATNVDQAMHLISTNPDINKVVLDGSPRGSFAETTADLAKEIRTKLPECDLIAATGEPGRYGELRALCRLTLCKPFSKAEFLSALGLS